MGYIDDYDENENSKHDQNTNGFIKMSIGIEASDDFGGDVVTLEGGHDNVQQKLMGISSLSNAGDFNEDMYDSKNGTTTSTTVGCTKFNTAVTSNGDKCV